VGNPSCKNFERFRSYNVMFTAWSTNKKLSFRFATVCSGHCSEMVCFE